MVRRLSETGGEVVPPDLNPIDVDTTDEIGEVARAFDQVHREALRLAANEAMLRGNVSAMFVNLSRRSQSLVERQIQLIDELEQDEEDADRLASLFQMDHLATRMRRNSETCSYWRATRRRGSGASRSRSSMCCVRRCRRSSSSTGYRSMSSRGSPCMGKR